MKSSQPRLHDEAVLARSGSGVFIDVQTRYSGAMRSVRTHPFAVTLATSFLLATVACDEGSKGDKGEAKAADAGPAKADVDAKGEADPKAMAADGGADKASADADEADADATLAEKVVADAVAQAEQEAGLGKIFDPGLTKRACEYLSPELIEKLFEVPAAELKTVKVMGCVQNWNKDGQTVEARLMMLRVHESVDDAKQWFANVTATKTKEQMDAEFEQVKGKLDERKELDTALKKDTAASLTDIAKMSTPEGGIVYEDAPGIGDEARISRADGNLWIRVGNLTFQVGAYKGAAEPQLPFDPKNTKGFAAAVMAAQKQWLADTYEQRKKDALTLAPHVLQAIAAGA